MKSFSQRLFFLTALAVSAAAVPAFADIYSFKDERGVVHFTNLTPTDKRFKLIRREANNPSPMPASFGAPVYYMPDAAAIQRFSALIESAAHTHGVDAALVHAVISAESGYNPAALSKAGARGLMQLMPATAQRYGVQNIMDPQENIHGGVKYLKDLLQMFSGNLELAVAAYNAGENAVIRHGHKVPPYAETVNYVPKVLGFYNKFRMRKG
jgi:soluble lytic murein transglycosylase-like protein